MELKGQEVLEGFDNGSIVHTRTEKMYHMGQYEIYHLDRDDELIFKVCSDEDDGVVSAGGKMINFDPVQALLSTVLTTISLIFLMLHIIIYSSLKKLRNQPSKNLMSLVCSLFLG